MSFALIGVVNVLIDTSVLFLAVWYINATPAALRPLEAFADACGCASHESIVLATANTISGRACACRAPMS